MFRGFKTTVSAIVVLATTICSSRAEARWYIGHLGAEICVPLSDVGDNMERLYYGSGQMRTPEDFAQHMRNQGAHMELLSGMPNFVTAYKGSGPGVREAAFPFFESEEMCQTTMAQLNK
jgi:hypothetical protein